MNNFKNSVKANFTAIPNTAVNDNRLSWKAKGIFLYLASKPDDWEFYMNEIKKNATDGKTSLQTGIKELEKCGYLRRTKSTDENNKFNGWNWELLIPRQSESPTDGNPDNRETTSYTNTNSTKKEVTKKDSIYPFDAFWDDYDHKKERKKCERKWKKLSEDERETIKEFVPIYLAHTPDKNYRKYPSTFLNNEIWNDDWDSYKPKTNTNGTTKQNRAQRYIDRAQGVLSQLPE